MTNAKKLIDQLCHVVTSFLCQSGSLNEIERCGAGPHIFSKGGSQAICTIKLAHGQIYNLEFVYRYWMHILDSCKYPFSPVFIICNNGLAVTLKCFICEPRDLNHQFTQTLSMSPDVNLQRNTSVALSQDDFIKFKTPLVFAKDLDIINSMVVCRTYLTSHRQSLQFLVVRSKNPRRLTNVLEMIEKVIGRSQNLDDLERMPIHRRPIKEIKKRYSSSSEERRLESPVDIECPVPSQFHKASSRAYLVWMQSLRRNVCHVPFIVILLLGILTLTLGLSLLAMRP